MSFPKGTVASGLLIPIQTTGIGSGIGFIGATYKSEKMMAAVGFAVMMC